MSAEQLYSKQAKVKKVLKYVSIYGLSRTLVKVKGHYHMSQKYEKSFINYKKTKEKNIAIIGCGNHAYTDIAYFLKKNRGNVIGITMDIDKNKAISLANEYKAYNHTINVKDIYEDDNIKLVSIVSNHATHAPYTIEALKANKDVFVEKPIAVNMQQYRDLIKAVRSTNNSVYVGYNRPFSPAIETIKSYITNKSITLNCFILGHKLSDTHWYRNPSEGSRVVSNLGHWIDLSTHLVMSRDDLPFEFEITLLSANSKHKDDDFVVTIKTNLDDLIVLTFSTRSDPFEGVMENISFQNEKIISIIDNFRKMTIWGDREKIVKKYISKDAGHEKSVIQPFLDEKRDWKEIEWSTFIMLKIEDMIQNDIKDIKFNIVSEIDKIIN